MYDNVNLWFAKDANNNIVTIDEVNLESKDNFYCPMCGSDLIPKAIKSKLITAHFAHIDASKCNGEGMIHFWFKNKFLESGDKFTIISDKEMQYICKEVLVEQSYNVGDKIYRPDVTVLTECGNTIYFEMDYSNKKKVQDYIDIWLELRNIVVEVDIKKLMSRDKIPAFKALFYNGKCFNTKKSDTYYNTIGKYKEEVMGSVDKVDDDLKERIQKLDWFWDDVLKYKKDEVDIEYMADLIDSIDGEERNVVFTILNKPKCIELYRYYQSYKKQEYKEQIDIIIKEIESKHNSLVKITYNLENLKSIHIYSKLDNVRDKDWISIGSSSGGSYDLKHDIEYINNQIKCEINHIKQVSIQNELINNEYLINAIELADSKYKLINNLYNIKLIWNGRTGIVDTLYHVYIECKYNDCRINDLEIDITNEDICRSSNIENIFNFICNKIDRYRDNITPLYDLRFIINVIDDINQRLEKIRPIRYKGSSHKVYLKYYNCSEDQISIYLYSISKWFNCDFLITGNSIYYNHKLLLNLTKDNFIQLENILFDIISNYIRDERYKVI